VDVGEGLQEFVNPVLVESHGRQTSVESCLSFPDWVLTVERPERVVVTGFNRTGEPVRCEATGLLAMALCHELDLLNGILFMDSLSDEEMFLQLSQQLEMDFGVDDVGSSDVLEQARWDEVELGLQMLADASWKLLLVSELLNDHRDLLSPDVDVSWLEEVGIELSRRIDEWEARVAESLEPAGNRPGDDRDDSTGDF